MAELNERLQSVLGDAYRVERELGGGGMGRVFLAEDVELRRKVVVKVLPPDLAAGLNADRFRREIQLAASLQHPHIVPLFAAGHDGDLLYYTMPFIKGESLQVRLAREGELPIGDAVRILRDVVDALACAHAEGVVHRDIKPANVLLSGGHALVTDFGVAKALSDATGASALTSAGMALGTPAYMAPEQAVGDPHTDHRADIYAVGVLAYETLTGLPPFNDAVPQKVLAAHVTEAPIPVTRRRAAIPPPLAAAVMRCLEKRPADRWQSAEQLVHHLETLATPTGGTAPYAVVSSPGEPVVAGAGMGPPPSGTPGTAKTGAAEPRASPVERSPLRRALWPWLAAAALLAVAGGGYLLHTQRSAVADAGSDKTLVVLPFENLGPPEDGYFADGITEEITSRLSGVPGLRVTSRTTAMQYKGSRKTTRQIGQELNAAYLLEGSVRWDREGKGPSRIRVTPQLIRVSDDSHIWADRYDAVMAEVLDVQTKIAEQVVGALDVALGSGERQALAARPTENPEAYDFYLRGLEYLHGAPSAPNVTSARDVLGKAVAADSGFALAWSALAQAEALAYWQYYDHTTAALDRAARAAQRALALEPDLPEAHLAMGFYDYWGHRDYAAALGEFELVRRARPNDADVLEAIGLVQRRQGRWDEALASIERAAQLEPRVPGFAIDAGETAMLMRRYPAAVRHLDRIIGLIPDLGEAFGLKAATIAAWTGSLDETRKLMQAGAAAVGREAFVGGNGMLLVSFGTDADRRWLLGLAPQVLSASDPAGAFLIKAEAARVTDGLGAARPWFDSLRVAVESQLEQRPEDDRFHSQLGLAYAGLGRKAEAIREGHRSLELLPVSRDAYFGGSNLIVMAEIFALVGEPDSADTYLETAVKIPSVVSPAALRIDALWTPLRSDPRFRRLTAH